MVTIKCDPLGKKVYRMDTEHAHMLYLGDKDFSLSLYIYYKIKRKTYK